MRCRVVLSTHHERAIAALTATTEAAAQARAEAHYKANGAHAENDDDRHNAPEQQRVVREDPLCRKVI